MNYTIKQQEWQCLPEHAQREVYDFFLFIKARYANDNDNIKPVDCPLSRVAYEDLLKREGEI